MSVVAGLEPGAPTRAAGRSLLPHHPFSLDGDRVHDLTAAARAAQSRLAQSRLAQSRLAQSRAAQSRSAQSGTQSGAAARTAGAGTAFSPIGDALDALAAGRPVVVVDGETRTNTGHLMFAAERASVPLVAFAVRHGCGFLRVPLLDADCRRLDLPPMVHRSTNQRGTDYTVSVDAAEGVTTGISATDRAHTIGLLAAGDSTPEMLNRPGHVLPLRAVAGGVLRRAGHTEAGVDLARLAGLRPAAAMTELVSRRDPRFMAGRAELAEFCRDHDLRMVSIAGLIAHRRETEPQVERVVTTTIPTEQGAFTAVGYRSLADGREFVAFVRGDLTGAAVPVRLHVECLLGDVFGSLRCACRARLDDALTTLAQRDRGVVVYLRGQGAGALCAETTGAADRRVGGTEPGDLGDLRSALTAGSVDDAVFRGVLADLGVADPQDDTGRARYLSLPA